MELDEESKDITDLFANTFVAYVVEKMEKRISLLGNHGMEPPAVAEKWYWMNTDFENSFLKIFEGNNRKST